MSSKKRLKAVVRVTLDIEADSVWGDDCTWEQIAAQAEDGVRDLLANDNELALETLARRIRNLQMVEVIVRAEGTP